ncbi:MAG: hypothetical protein NXY57DRAFT_1106683 [Lentinula lateritia]|nr:MAG: hypothetical protein NXY57DRAFT_1106683 [Lentinula lateritia]
MDAGGVIEEAQEKKRLEEYLLRRNSTFVSSHHTPPSAISTSTNIRLNRQTILANLYYYPPSTVLDYPSTSMEKDKPVGHLLEQLPQWRDVMAEIQYSLGPPRSQRKNIFLNVLTDLSGEPVPCVSRYATCQGVKVCPFIDTTCATIAHISVGTNTMEVYRGALSAAQIAGPYQEVYEHTLALWATFRDNGCLMSIEKTTTQSTDVTVEEVIQRVQVLQIPRKAARGHQTLERCTGRLYLIEVDNEILVRCEHFTAQSKMHLNFTVRSSTYDLKYFRALFYGDQSIIQEIEEKMKTDRYGPLVPCTTIRNCSSMTVNCENQHRQSNGSMTMVELKRLPCQCRITVYEPVAEFREQCMKSLIVCHGPHRHPPPVPSTTPPLVAQNLIAFIKDLDDLPNLTARRLLSKESTRIFLRQQLPDIPDPSLMDLHHSLGNLDHLQVYVTKAIRMMYPRGTGWEATQDATLKDSERYIRYAEEFQLEHLVDETQYLGQVTDAQTFRLVICMKSENSFRLVNDARHIQSDISFKRVVGWLEFELGGFDRVNRTARYWEGFTIPSHLHALDKDDVDFHGILSWTVDQHRGQAKGIGEFLQALAPTGKADLYNPQRALSDLGPYEHLERILRLCFAHYARNIQKCQVTSDVKDKMFSIAGTWHKDGSVESWKSTLAFIREYGVHLDWLNDKIESKFALPAICWQYSQHIPFKIWQASDETSNTIEALHQDQLREGSGLSLLGGLLQGERYDQMRLKQVQIQQSQGITPRYQISTPSSQAYRSVNRQISSKKRQYTQEDAKISKQNEKFRNVTEKVEAAYDNQREAQRKVRSGVWPQQRLDAAGAALLRAEQEYAKVRASSSAMREAKLGSGFIQVDV